MSPQNPITAMAYLWVAERDVDRRPDTPPQYIATNTRNTPLAGADLLHPASDVTPWTVRRWRLLGTARATAVVGPDNEVRLKMWTALQYGVDVAISEAILHGWFTKA